MSILYLVGSKLNAVDGALSITVSSENTLFPKANLYNTVPAEYFAFNAAGSNDTIDVDLDRLTDGGFEEWDDASTPTHWTKSGTVAREATTIHGGTYSAKLSADAEVSQIIWVPSGWDMTVDCWIYGDGTYWTRSYLQNLYTGYWLNSSEEWQASETYFATKAAAAWGQFTRSFTVEGYSTCGYQHLVPLELSFTHQTGGSGGYVDDAALWPHYDFCSIHGHNINPQITVKVQSDDNSSFSSATDRKTMTVVQPAFHGTFTAVTERYARILFSGTNYEAIKVGELILGQYGTLAQAPQSQRNLDTSLRFPQYRHRSRPGHIYRNALSDEISRRVSFDYIAKSTADQEEMREFLHRARYGVDLAVLVPFDDEGTVIYGPLSAKLVETRHHARTDYYVYAIDISESPYWLSLE